MGKVAAWSILSSKGTEVTPMLGIRAATPMPCIHLGWVCKAGMQGFVVVCGSVAVRLGHGLGLSMGSSIGEGNAHNDDDRRTAGDQHGESKAPL